MTEVLEGELLLDTGLARGQLTIEGGRIARVVTDSGDFDRSAVVVGEGGIIAPGFIDVQINGAFGKEFKSDGDAVEHVSARLPEFGTTSFCATVTTLPTAAYPEHLAALRAGASHADGARCIGFHLEGPALNPAKVGAQSADLLVSPGDLDLDAYVGPAVRIVTFAPELPGARQFLDALFSRDVRVGVGHSTIEYDELVGLFDPERMMVVHAFNAMADLNSRKPGVIGAVLDRDDYYSSVIADRIHVSDPTLRIFWKSKRDRSRVIAITDGSAVTGLPTGIHQIGARTIEKRADRAVLHGTETLVGSTLTLDVAVRNLSDVTGCGVADALRCVTANPARFLGIESEFGSLTEGAHADLVCLTPDLVVQRTIVGGQTVWET